MRRDMFYIDGSKPKLQLPGLRQCGWLQVMRDDYNKMLRAVYRLLLKRWQDGGRAVLLAFIMFACCVGAATANLATKCMAVFVIWEFINLHVLTI